MAETNPFVIQYLSDISNIKSRLKEIEKLNKDVALKMEKDFAKGIDTISAKLKSFKTIKIFDKKGEFKGAKSIAEFERVIKTTDGSLKTVTTSMEIVGKHIRKTSETVKDAKKSFKGLTKEQQALIGKSSQLATNFKSFSNINRTFANQLKGSGKASKLLGTSLDQVSSTGSKVSKIFETSNNKFVKLTQTIKKLPNGIQQVSRSVEKMSKSQAQNARVLERSNVTTKTLGQNFASLAKRAALTIPVWFALRGAIFGTFRTIKEGLTNIADFDNALQKLRRNLEATSSNVDRDFTKARKVIEEFSLKSGKSVQEITNAIQKFATVGFGFETALEGGLRATQLAITLFGDAEETAQAFARSLRVLTEGMDDPIERQLAIARALALTDQLWQTNAFEISEFSTNLEKFAGTAKIANLSIEDTLKLLATLSTGGLKERGGRLLKTTVLKSLGEFDKINRALKLNLDPDKSTTIDFLLSMIDALEKLGVTGEKVPVALAEKLRELFSVRSTEPLAALVSLKSTLKENFALIPDIEKFDSTMERLLSKTGSLAEQFTNVKTALGRLFVEGLVGGDNFEKSLENIVNFLRESTDEVEKLGFVFNSIGVGIGEVIKLISKAEGLPPLAGLSFIKDILNLSFEIKKTEQALDEASLSALEFGKQLQKALSGDLNLTELKRVITDLEARLKINTIDLGLDQIALKKSVEVLKQMLEIEQKISDEKTKQTNETEQAKIRETQRIELAKLILTNELEILRARGALASQITETEQLLRKQLSIEKKHIDQLADQLKKEREITEERRLRSDLGNESLKLFRIAKTEGVEVARKIGDVLAGNTDFSSFVRRGGEELELFKKQFADIFEQQQALSFFKGDVVPGEKGLRGGTRIAIEEEALRTPVRQLNVNALLQQKALERALIKLKIPVQNIEAGVVNINTTGNIDALRQLYNAGAPLRGADAQALAGGMAKRVTESRTVIDVNIVVDGKNINFQATAEDARLFAKQLTSDPNVLGGLEDSIVNQLENSQSKISKGVDNRIDKF